MTTTSPIIGKTLGARENTPKNVGLAGRRRSVAGPVFTPVRWHEVYHTTGRYAVCSASFSEPGGTRTRRTTLDSLTYGTHE